MDKNKLNEILNKHKIWLSGGPLGECANLRDANLRDADLQGANLQDADLRYADLRDAYLQGANLQGANLQGANLQGADLRGANLQGADLRDAYLQGANLRYADLRYADLRYADLRYADLRYAELWGANLRDADLRDSSVEFPVCPKEGAFIGWKKCKNNKLVKLLIPEDAKRSSATSRKCRCDKAKVLRIVDAKGNEIKSAESTYCKDFFYHVGETVEVLDFDTNRWNECSTGIHFFMTREEAERY